MTDRPDIWRRLKDHEELPPEEVGNRLQHMLEGMERLQQHEVPPPLFLRQEIEQRKGIKPAASGKVRWYISAAACLVLMIAGWIVYRSNTRTAPNTVATDKKQPSPGAAGVPARRDTLTGNTDTSGEAATMTADAGALTGSGQHTPLSFSIEGQSIPVTDNDLLATFTGFVYPDVPLYLTRNADKPLNIHIDQYTNITVSKNMLDLMKQLYQVLPNGRPARKARRAKRRLDTWKEKDQKRFDKGVGANPLDPVDLAEFIFR